MAPRLSVIIATTHGCSYVQDLLDAILPQCDAADAEVWIADGSGNCFPDALRHSRIRYLSLPGASVFDLRAVATSQAAGEIVAWTEDHCLPSPDWCEATLAAHHRYPETQVIGGAVANGTASTSLDCANFLVTLGAFVGPMKLPLRRRAPPVANLSFKRRALPPGPLPSGFIEMVFCARQLQAGRTQFLDAIRVKHFQSRTGWDAFEAHFHNGRSTTGILAGTWPVWRRVRQVPVCFLMPAEVTWTAVSSVMGKPGIQWARHLPLIFGLGVAFGAGELAGLIAGPGRSPNRLV